MRVAAIAAQAVAALSQAPDLGQYRLLTWVASGVGKNLGLVLESTKTESGDRRYSVKG